MNHFLVIGLFGTGGPVTVCLEEIPFVNLYLETGPGWNGVTPGTRVRVTYVSIKHERDDGVASYPRSMIYVVEV